jgi:phospholipase C
MDAATPAVDTTNEGTVAEPVYNTPIDPAKTVGMSIADQLDEAHMSWKSYQESLPPYGADGVNNSDGLLSNLTQTSPGVPNLYAVKHNPFVYFASVQSGEDRDNSLRNVVDLNQLYIDLAHDRVPNFAFIAPNQCHDMHGRGSTEVGPGCSVDANNIAQGDAAVKALITGIKSSKMWKEGNNVIVTFGTRTTTAACPTRWSRLWTPATRRPASQATFSTTTSRC